MVSGVCFSPLTQKFSAGLKTGVNPASSPGENARKPPWQSRG